MKSALNKQTKTCGGVIKGTAGMNLGSATAWQQVQGRLKDHMKGVLDKVHSPHVALRWPILAPLTARVKINVHTIYIPIDSYEQVFLGEFVSEIGILNFYHCAITMTYSFAETKCLTVGMEIIKNYLERKWETIWFCSVLDLMHFRCHCFWVPASKAENNSCHLPGVVCGLSFSLGELHIEWKALLGGFVLLWVFGGA